MAFVLATLLLTSTTADLSCSSGLPIIDVAPFLRPDATAAERREVAQAWDAAMSSTGLAQIVGHGVDPTVIDRLVESANRFFELSAEQKMQSCLNKGYGFGGYVPQGVEAVGRSTGAEAPADIVENLVFSFGGDRTKESVMPSEPAQLEPAVQAYWEQMERLLRSLMELSASALGLKATHFSDVFRTPKCNLRLAYYPAMAAEAEKRPEGLRYGAHTDYTGFTILRQDTNVSGLQAQTADGEWVLVPPRADAFVINAGDLIQVWSNDRWRSPPHRVVNPPPGSTPRSRLSLVFFTGPDEETMIEALPGTHGPDRPKRYEPVLAREHLRRKLQAGNV